MITFYNPHHALHQGQFEMFRGALVPCHEVPARADHVLAELQRRQLGEVRNPQRFAAAALESVHSPRYLQFLETAWSQWVAIDPANGAVEVSSGGILTLAAGVSAATANAAVVFKSAADILQKVIRANSRLSSKQNASLH